VLLTAPTHAAVSGERPFVFEKCGTLDVRVIHLPPSLRSFDFQGAVAKRLRDAGVLAETEGDLTMGLRVIELPSSGETSAYMVDINVFHRTDDHEYGRGRVILWGSLGVDQYRGGNPGRGLIELAEELTDSFVKDYRADGCGRSGWW
ncbi:MAG: hypothetical protein OXQ29_17130, partial [Rhodospirillaceae bacterium]|nr:hypothetical protein [Rhodospirillaceae bacterium]